MNFIDHSNLSGIHAPFSASQPYWLGQTDEEMKDRYISKWLPTIGTAAHAFAETLINERLKLTKNDVKMFKLYLLDNATAPIPRYIVDSVDLYFLFDNIQTYVNDAIGFKMTAEQILYYSDLFFGTADAISFNNNVLRIHDLKTGRGHVKIEQLLIYAALFCLEYKIKPNTIDIELRIYQSGLPVLYHEPTAEEIVPIMDQIVSQDKELSIFMRKEE